jgi:hypothetical protein
LGVVALIVDGAITDIREGEFYPIALVFPLLLFIPAAILAFGLRKNRIPILLVILGLLIAAVPLAGILRFNEMSIATIGKALFFVPLLVGLGYFGFIRVFGKS